MQLDPHKLFLKFVITAGTFLATYEFDCKLNIIIIIDKNDLKANNLTKLFDIFLIIVLTDAHLTV